MQTQELITPTLVLEGYEALRSRVNQVLVQGRARMEHEKVRTYSETGRVILDYFKKNPAEVGHGKRMISKLAGDLGISSSVLHRVVKFAAMFPKVARGPLLTWSHYRALIGVTSNDRRHELEAAALEGSWSAKILAAEIKASASGTKPKLGNTTESSLLYPRVGTLEAYQIKEVGGKSVIDLGFEIYRPLDARGIDRLKPGTIVRMRENKITSVEEGLTRSDVFTYSAKVLKVVDGDTLRVLIDLGFNTQVRQYLRLRGLDTPELKTEQGRVAKAFVEERLRGVPSITINTTRSDKYDRYLSDVFYLKEGHEHFLNNELLTARLAVRV